MGQTPLENLLDPDAGLVEAEVLVASDVQEYRLRFTAAIGEFPQAAHG